MTQRVHMGRSTLLTMVSRVLGLGSGFLTSIMLARALDTAGKGELALLLQTPNILVTVLSLGMGTAAAYFVGRGMRTAGEAFSDSMLVVTVVSVLGIPISVLVSRLMPALAGVHLGLIVLAGVTVPLAVGLLVVNGIVTGVKRVEQLATRQTVANLIGLVLIAVPFFMHALTLETSLIVTISSSVVMIAVTVRICWRDIRETIVRPSLARIRDAAGYSMRAYVGAVASLLGRRQDVLLLGYLSTASQVGIYSIGVVFAEILWQVSSAISTPLLARSLQEDEVSGARVAAQAGRIAFTATFAIMLGIGAVIIPLVNIVYSSAFGAAAYVYLLLAPGILVYGLGSVLAQYMMTHGRLFPRLSIVVTVANLLINLALIPKFGIYGASVSSTISYTMGGVYLTRAFLSRSELPLSAVLFMHRADFVALKASVASALPRTSPKPAEKDGGVA